MAVNTNGMEVTLPWHEITGASKEKSCGLDELFRVGEDVKVCRKGKKPYSMQVLERVPGEVFHNKAKVFEEADETAHTSPWKRLRKQKEQNAEINVSVVSIGSWGPL